MSFLKINARQIFFVAKANAEMYYYVGCQWCPIMSRTSNVSLC